MQISVIIKSNSKHREEVAAGDDGGLTVFTKAPAIESRANEAAVRLLAKYYGVSKSQVRLVRGHTSKFKVFEIDSLSPDEIRRRDEELITVILPTIQ